MTAGAHAPERGAVRLDDEEAVKRVLVDTTSTFPQCVDTADEAIAIIRDRHAMWTPIR